VRLEMYNWADDWPGQPVLNRTFYLVPGERTPTPDGQRDMLAAGEREPRTGGAACRKLSDLRTNISLE
jgi:hypothetical protein